jgi:hypothetical protein
MSIVNNQIIATKEDIELGKWMSAALSDKNVCKEMKDDINNWLNSKEWPEEQKEAKENTGNKE